MRLCDNYIFSKLNIPKYSTIIVTLLSLLPSGGFALLAGTGATLAGLGGPAAAAVGAVTLTGVPGVVTGLMPLVGAAALGALGRTISTYNI